MFDFTLLLMSDVVKAFDSESVLPDWSSVKWTDLRADDGEFLTLCLSFFNDVSDGFQKTRTDSRTLTLVRTVYVCTTWWSSSLAVLFLQMGWELDERRWGGDLLLSLIKNHVINNRGNKQAVHLSQTWWVFICVALRTPVCVCVENNTGKTRLHLHHSVCNVLRWC